MSQEIWYEIQSRFCGEDNWYDTTHGKFPTPGAAFERITVSPRLKGSEFRVVEKTLTVEVFQS